MNRFDQQLLRLKEAIGVVRDDEVAAALGMSKAALSNRKKNQSFPDEKLAALKAQFPNLDIAYVLTGERWEAAEFAMENIFFESSASRNDEALSASAARAIQFHVQEFQAALKHKQVRLLIGLLTFCDDAAIDDVVRFASRRMGPKPISFQSRDASADVGQALAGSPTAALKSKPANGTAKRVTKKASPS